MDNVAKTLADLQREASLAHHRNRIIWLTSENPTWSCGTPVSETDRKSMLKASRLVLGNPLMSYNHCQCKPLCA